MWRLLKDSLWPLAVLALLAACTDRWTPHLVRDTPSYWDYSFDSPTAIARQIRSPGYPACLRLAQSLTSSDQAAEQLVVVLQYLLHALAAGCLITELTRWSLPRIPAIASGLAVAVGCTFWDHGNTIATDAPSLSLAVLLCVLTLRVWRVGLNWVSACGLVAIATLTIAVRPAYLFLMVWLPMVLLVRPTGSAWEPIRQRMFDASRVSLPLLAIMLGWCGFRYQTVGEFAPLPFGHQNLAAVTTQLLDQDELESLSGINGQLGSQIAQRRTQLSKSQADGLDLRPVPDPSLRADAYMTIENRWDAMTYLVVYPVVTEVVGEAPVAQHQALADLNSEVIRRYPFRYLKWWLLSIRRGIWGGLADLAMHPIFLLAGMMLIGTTMWRVTRPTYRNTTVDWSLLYPLVWLSLTFALAKIAFVALTSPAIGRFSDAAMVFIPAWLAASAVLWLTGERDLQSR